MAIIAEDRKPFTVNIRWFDGYLETFYEVTDVRHGSDLLWLVLATGQNRHIPLRQVRWFGLGVETHEVVTDRSMLR